MIGGIQSDRNPGKTGISVAAVTAKIAVAQNVVSDGKVLAGTYIAFAPDAPAYGMPVTVGVQLLGGVGEKGIIWGR